MKVTYSSNNSGGNWWLNKEQWEKLKAAGWDISRPSLGAIATDAEKEFNSIEEAIDEFMAITGEDPYAEGCECCGPPHSFYESYE
jgi:hypothetical protein